MGTQPRNGFKRVEPERELVTVPDEGPTLEQCENVAVAMGLPILPEGLRPSYYEDSMRNLHALAVRMLNGDESAQRTLETLQRAFGRQPDTVQTPGVPEGADSKAVPQS